MWFIESIFNFKALGLKLGHQGTGIGHGQEYAMPLKESSPGHGADPPKNESDD
jgi:hypothetical protein